MRVRLVLFFMHPKNAMCGFIYTHGKNLYKVYSFLYNLVQIFSIDTVELYTISVSILCLDSLKQKLQIISDKLANSLVSVIIILLYRQTFCHHCQRVLVTHPSLLTIATNEIFLL